ncbi:MAG: DegV family protein [Dehalococcoidia bacterium]|nr:MAG: DegV family protein [Dehalococcoidia bacterium]
MTVKIVTDSVCDFPHGVAKELGISVVPLNVRFGDEVYRDGIDMTAEEFYRRLQYDKILPVTSVPTPATFAEIYDKVAEETDEILAIMLTSKLSGTYQVAVQSVGLMKRKCRVEVIDSGLAVMAQGMVVITAARAAQAGASFDEVMDITRRNLKRADMRAAFDTLEYLRRGGRIGAAQAFLGSVLKINPIIMLKDGVVQPAGKERSWSKIIDYLTRFVTSHSCIEEMAIEDAMCPDDAELLAERVSPHFPKERIFRSKTGPVIGTHTGPHTLVVSVLGDK